MFDSDRKKEKQGSGVFLLELQQWKLLDFKVKNLGVDDKEMGCQMVENPWWISSVIMFVCLRMCFIFEDLYL